MNIFIDIETIPAQPEDEVKALIASTIQAPGQMSKAETIAAWHAGEGAYAGAKDALIEKSYRDTSLDGAKGEIISISFANDECDPLTFSRSDEKIEKDLLRLAFDQLRELLSGKSPWWIGHNIGGFDLKYMFQRCVINKQNPNLDFKQYGRHGVNFYDTSQAWAGYGGRISQDNLCKALGIPGKPSDICGANVWDHYKAGNISRIAEYNGYDVDTVRQIWKRLNFL